MLRRPRAKSARPPLKCRNELKFYKIGAKKKSECKIKVIYIEKPRAPCYNFYMDRARVKSYAKINLSLDIVGTRGGFHMLDSAVVTVDIADVISVAKRKKDK